jgi:hypothetical protein
MNVLCWLLVAEAIAYATASLIHAEVLLPGNPDPAASTAEGIIAVVLVAGAAVSWLRPAWTRLTALLVQGFALAGTSIGLYLFVTLTPEKVADIVFHVVIMLVLAGGLVLAARLRR